MDAQFAAGEIVQLRSGGPRMTTVGPGRNAGFVNVVYWNSVSGIMVDWTFDQRVLRLANSTPEVPEGTNKLRSTSVAKSSMS